MTEEKPSLDSIVEKVAVDAKKAGTDYLKQYRHSSLQDSANLAALKKVESWNLKDGKHTGRFNVPKDKAGELAEVVKDALISSFYRSQFDREVEESDKVKDSASGMTKAELVTSAYLGDGWTEVIENKLKIYEDGEFDTGSFGDFLMEEGKNGERSGPLMNYIARHSNQLTDKVLKGLHEGVKGKGYDLDNKEVQKDVLKAWKSYYDKKFGEGKSEGIDSLPNMYKQIFGNWFTAKR